MSDCDFCISANEDFSASFYDSKIITARKEFKCCECGRVMPKGTQYEKVVGVWEGEWMKYRTCLDCYNIRSAFACNGWLFECLWDDIAMNFQEVGFNEGCLAKVETASAKAYLVERWRKWKGLSR